jgi:hypothetical protein
MPHLSAWHSFDVNNADTYPKENSAMQVRYADGSFADGYTFDFFPTLTTPPETPITAWRYIKVLRSSWL